MENSSLGAGGAGSAVFLPVRQADRQQRKQQKKGSWFFIVDFFDKNSNNKIQLP